MPQKMPWIERRFAFEIPVSMFPSLLERLRGTPARAEERTQGLAVETLTLRAGDSWSIQENIGHLIEVERLWLGRLDDYAAGLEELRPADMSNRSTYGADYNKWELSAVLAGFRQARGEYVARLEAMDDEILERQAYHARLGKPMRVLDAMLFAAEHDDHHLARISELRRYAAGKGTADLLLS